MPISIGLDIMAKAQTTTKAMDGLMVTTVMTSRNMVIKAGETNTIVVKIGKAAAVIDKAGGLHLKNPLHTPHPRDTERLLEKIYSIIEVVM